MVLVPNKNEHLAAELRRVYADAETEILALIARRVADGLDSPDWMNRKLAEVRDHRREVEKIILRLRVYAPNFIDEIVRHSFNDGVEEAVSDYKAAELVNTTLTTFEGVIDTETIAIVSGGINTYSVEALVAATKQNLDAAHLYVLRSADDAYRRVVAEAGGQVLTGIKTRKQASQEALFRFADEGIEAFRDKTGRRWDLASYAEMSVRAAVSQAAVNGYLTETVQRGRDLVRVSDHPEECAICRPWEGRILSITGQTEGYKTVQDARGGGLWHPGCGHRLHSYIPGLSDDVTPDSDPDGYALRERQRYYERMVRYWKRRELLSITDEAKRQSVAKVRAWQARLREFTDEHDRRRRYDRESITRAR